jgi:hypothetical protein
MICSETGCHFSGPCSNQQKFAPLFRKREQKAQQRGTRESARIFSIVGEFVSKF